ncbi:hypothetical protein [Longimicrobium sp.]|uniref:hypothetical protein n=1 Tax=Longimicrobium sp. TaxID=2029185 RepID=UPI002D1A0AEC|nr:hypothetical protein [Longimicrobium sp.]HSU12922.1 hypothetical protein [Longimicrobium sp.]
MRPKLLLALLSAVPLLCAASPRAAVAQRHREPARVYVSRDGRGYRDRIFIPTRSREPVRRVRIDLGRQGYRDGYRQREVYAYRDGYRVRRGVSVVDLLLLAARARYRDGYEYRDRYPDRGRYSGRSRHSSRGRGHCRGGGRHIRI